MRCAYCDRISDADESYRGRDAAFDLGSSAPRCPRHWRFRCGHCGRAAHFMAAAHCPASNRFYCGDCALGTEVVRSAFYGWDYYFVYTSPWSGEPQPSLDRAEFEDRHPYQLAPDLEENLYGCATDEAWLVRYPAWAPQHPADDHGFDERAVSAAWDANAEPWDAALGLEGDDMRKYHTNDALLDVLGEVDGLDVLDIGAGNGYLSRILARRGARVTGVELSPRMVALAEVHTAAERLDVRYVVASATDLSAFADGSFDRIVCAFVLMSVEDQDAVLAESHRVLRDGGTVVLVITHPCFSAGPRRWLYDSPDSPRPEESSGYVVDYYLAPTRYVLDEWEGFQPVPYFHRPLSAYWRSFTTAGFRVTAFVEPGLSPRGAAELPPGRASQSDRVPLACIFTLVRDGAALSS